MMNSIDIWKIIQDIKLIPSITAIVWNNIFFWEPRNEDDITTDLYIVINIISQTPSSSWRDTRIELRFLSKKDNTTKQSLIDLCTMVTNSLCFTTCNWIKDFNWFKVSSFIEWPDFRIFVWDNERNLLIKDYIVTFFKDTI